jgi:hypothetical protein
MPDMSSRQESPPPSQPSPYQPGYPPYGAYCPPARPTNTMAILALVFAFVFPPVGIALGFIARKRIDETREDGEGIALAGIIFGSVFTGIGMLSIIFAVVVFGSFLALLTSLAGGLG